MKVEIWCTKHWRPVLDSRLHTNPINGTAATEFLLRRFMKDVEREDQYKNDLAGGLTPSQAQAKALANLAPICCLYGTDSMQQLQAACRYIRLERSHPRMNNIDDPEGLYHLPRGYDE